jgi:hypothetical protein
MRVKEMNTFVFNVAQMQLFKDVLGALLDTRGIQRKKIVGHESN